MKNGIGILCLLVVCFFVVLDNYLIGPPADSGSNPSIRSQALDDFQKYHDKQFKVINVVDGDTLDIDIPDSDKEFTRIRLWGVDTPETKSPKTGVMYFGPEASEFTKDNSLNKQVRIFLNPDETRGYFGRLLAYVQLPNGEFLNETLILKGYGYADLRFKHDFYNKYANLEAAARNNKAGLWENIAQDQLPKWLQKTKPNLIKH
jgi:micrococcal nuclease